MIIVCNAYAEVIMMLILKTIVRWTCAEESIMDMIYVYDIIIIIL